MRSIASMSRDGAAWSLTSVPDKGIELAMRRSFLAELKRRRVYKMGAAYMVGAWLLVQVATQVFPFFEVPNAWVRWVIILAILGFPVAIALSWVFDLTPDGVVRTEEGVSPDEPAGRLSGARSQGRLNFVLGTLLAVAVCYLLVDHLYLRRDGVPATSIGPHASAQPLVSASIAVMPFADMSAEGDQGYFADGISEELLNLLAQVPQLHVVGRTSSFSFRGKNASVAEIGKALNVTCVLEGGVRKAGDRLRVTAQLITVADGFQLWSQTYDRELTDVFLVQDDIAGAVVDALKVKLLPADRPSTARQYVPDFETYDRYLLGRQLLVRNEPEHFAKAVDAFTEAIARDPNYAGAYAGLAMAESFASANLEDGAPRRLARTRAMAAAEKAVELGPELGDAYAARGYLRATNEWRWNEALSDSLRAVALDPADARNHLRHGYLLATLGRLPEAVAAYEKANATDPLFPPAWYWLGRTKAAQGDYAGARHALNRTLAIAPEYSAAQAYLGVVSLLQGDAGAARDLFAPLNRPLGTAMAEHDLGRVQEAERLLQDAIGAHSNDSAYSIAVTYAWMGNADAAFQWLDTAFEHHDDGLQYVKYDPQLRSIRTDARYRPFLRRLQLPE